MRFQISRRAMGGNSEVSVIKVVSDAMFNLIDCTEEFQRNFANTKKIGALLALIAPTLKNKGDGTRSKNSWI